MNSNEQYSSILVGLLLFFPGNEKITLCNTKKYKNQAGMNLSIIFFDPGTQFPGNEKITLCNAEKYYYYYYHIIIKERREAKTSGNHVASRSTSAIPELLVSTLFRFFSVGVIELSENSLVSQLSTRHHHPHLLLSVGASLWHTSGRASESQVLSTDDGPVYHALSAHLCRAKSTATHFRRPTYRGEIV